MDPTTFQMPLRDRNAFSMQGTMEEWAATETRGITPGRMDSVTGDGMNWGMMQRAICETLRIVQSVGWCVVDDGCVTGGTRME